MSGGGNTCFIEPLGQGLHAGGSRLASLCKHQVSSPKPPGSDSLSSKPNGEVAEWLKAAVC
jgi:hypothetical protein